MMCFNGDLSLKKSSIYIKKTPNKFKKFTWSDSEVRYSEPILRSEQLSTPFWHAIYTGLVTEDPGLVAFEIVPI